MTLRWWPLSDNRCSSMIITQLNAAYALSSPWYVLQRDSLSLAVAVRRCKGVTTLTDLIVANRMPRNPVEYRRSICDVKWCHIRTIASCQTGKRWRHSRQVAQIDLRLQSKTLGGWMLYWRNIYEIELKYRLHSPHRALLYSSLFRPNDSKEKQKQNKWQPP